MVTTATAFISVSMTKGTMKSDERRLQAAVSACPWDSSNALFKVSLRARKESTMSKVPISISNNRELYFD